jgi:hypothetical protein
MALAASYLFELDEQTGMAFSRSAWSLPSIPSMDEHEEDQYLRGLESIRLRPLMSGAGLSSLLDLYEKAISLENGTEQQFVAFIKAMEYVSATVVNSERNEQIRKRLLSPTALSPDASFIRDLNQLFETLRTFRKDAEALRLTLETCCDAVELAKHAPPKLTQLKSIKEESSAADKRKALEALSTMFTATRNMFSHAKANYSLTGDECPEKELTELTKCARVAARQCTRWYAHSDVSLRVAG